MGDEIASYRIITLDQTSSNDIETSCGCMQPKKIYGLLREVCDNSTLDRNTILPWSQRLVKVKTVMKTWNALVGRELLHKIHRRPLLLPFWRKTAYDMWRDGYGIWNTKIIRPPCFNWGFCKKEGGCPIQHSARPHIARIIKSFFTDYKWEALPRPAYRPNTSPPDCDLLPELKEPLPGQRFQCLYTLNAGDLTNQTA